MLLLSCSWTHPGQLTDFEALLASGSHALTALRVPPSDWSLSTRSFTEPGNTECPEARAELVSAGFRDAGTTEEKMVYFSSQFEHAVSQPGRAWRQECGASGSRERQLSVLSLLSSFMDSELPVQEGHTSRVALLCPGNLTGSGLLGVA